MIGAGWLSCSNSIVFGVTCPAQILGGGAQCHGNSLCAAADESRKSETRYKQLRSVPQSNFTYAQYFLHGVISGNALSHTVGAQLSRTPAGTTNARGR
eukprot:3050285-Prymnesium_polylepis.1